MFVSLIAHPRLEWPSQAALFAHCPAASTEEGLMSGLYKHCGWRAGGQESGGKRQVVRRGREGKSIAATPALVLENGKTFRVSSEYSFAELKILCNHYLINLKITPSNLLTLNLNDCL